MVEMHVVVERGSVIVFNISEVKMFPRSLQ